MDDQPFAITDPPFAAPDHPRLHHRYFSFSGDISRKEVMEEIEAGYVRVQHHPTLPLAILNYTEKATYDGHWTPITRVCRGLVVVWDENSPFLEIVIRPPEKFFNYNEPHAPNVFQWNADDCWITEKLDGYYIAIRDDSRYGLIVTSRGSFDNQYVEAAKKLIPPLILKNTDFFCELCQDFPGDESIIVTRHPEPRLVCWGVGDKTPWHNNTWGWTGDFIQSIWQSGIMFYLQNQHEGVVIYNKATHERVKVKTEWYLQMHRLISNCTFKRTLEIVSRGGQIDGQHRTSYRDAQGDIQTVDLEIIPEEHYQQMVKWESEINAEFYRISALAMRDYNEYKDKTPKEYALESNSPDDIKSLVFRRFKTRPSEMDEQTWKVVRKRLLRQTNNE